jgi:copper(I)-binding protein
MVTIGVEAALTAIKVPTVTSTVGFFCHETDGDQGIAGSSSLSPGARHAELGRTAGAAGKT